jgi:hypothetical protein
MPNDPERHAPTEAAQREQSAHEMNLAEAIWRLFAPFGGVELEPHPPTPVRAPPDFSDGEEEGA